MRGGGPKAMRAAVGWHRHTSVKLLKGTYTEPIVFNGGWKSAL